MRKAGERSVARQHKLADARIRILNLRRHRLAEFAHEFKIERHLFSQGENTVGEQNSTMVQPAASSVRDGFLIDGELFDVKQALIRELCLRRTIRLHRPEVSNARLVADEEDVILETGQSRHRRTPRASQSPAILRREL